MRIKYITCSSWWDTDVTVIPKLAEAFDLHVYCLNLTYVTDKYPHKTVPNGVQFTNIFQKTKNGDIKSIYDAIRYYIKIYFDHKNEDTIYFVMPTFNCWLFILFLLFLPKKRTIFSSHNYIEHGDDKGLLSKLIDFVKRNMYDRFSFFHFYSKNQLDLFKKDHPEKQAFFTEMPLKDFGEIQATQRQDNDIRLLFFGIIRDYKRLDWLIEAIKKLNVPNLKVIIAGNATESDKKKYRELIGESNAFDVHFGFVDNEDIPRYFSNSDFLVLPYDSATQSGPSLIALNYGIPIIASDVNTFKEIVMPKKTGYLFKTDSLDSLIRVLREVSSLSREDINKMKAAQLAFKERYNRENDLGLKFSQFVNNTILH